MTAGSCPPRQVELEHFTSNFPQAHAAGCRVFDATCRRPPGWIVMRGGVLEPLPVPGEPPKPIRHFVACPPSCFVYEDAPPTKDDPIPYCCPGHPDCPPGGTGCGDRPCPPGSRRTEMHPAGWSHPKYHWSDAYQVCCPTR